MYLLTFFLYLLRHKVYYLYFRFRLFPTIPLIEALRHDNDKFGWSFVPLAIYHKYNLDSDWNYEHRKSKPHHWEYWVTGFMDGNKKVIVSQIPNNWIEAMLCDWLAASACKTGSWRHVFSWYMENENSISLHPNTRKTVVNRLRTLL